ncbi:TolC family protein [Candidatus Sulfurimonas marisnigri]|uniref:TolC family protein n=1 Tax=Candidatus Sulfurimonas marisnigri TaxID=2740405 RepID=A0A7S7LYK6_9BACT|nr:TolC family protein [Candidatus Sulfurimonas marisnigri]QOY53767.1 TolC family protein [Candidatus Sulfurimonas marisnigri]
MFRIIFIFTCIGFKSVFSQELFEVDSIGQYLTKDNPYVYVSLGKKYVYEEKLNYALGDYDTKAVAKYEEKEYPVTYGKYYTLGLEKPLENGVDMSVSYRYAEGTQEYNNIKTSEDGEVLLGVKVPVISVLNQIDKRRLDVGLASIDVSKTDFQYKESMRNLYYEIMTNYYRLLYTKSLLDVSKELLLKVEKRYTFLEQRVKKGLLSEMQLIEVKQQVINREQIVLSACVKYDNQFLNFLKFLNISKEDFDEKYMLPDLPILETTNINFTEAMKIAMENRYDFKMFNNEIKKLVLSKKYIELLKYPDLNVGLYGVYDLKNDSDSYDQMGYKVSVNMTFPIEQRKYSANKLKNKHNAALLYANKNKLLLVLSTNLKNIITSLYALEKNILNSINEVELIKKLENLERRKYELGSSTLFILNQREIQTIETQNKLLKYKLDYLLLHQQYTKEVNLYPIGS